MTILAGMANQPFDPLDVLGEPAAPPRYSPPPPPIQQSAHSVSTGPFVCGSCGARTVGRPFMPGSNVIEILCWVLPVGWPIAIFYSAWRRLPKRRRCLVCGGDDLVHS